MKKLILGIIIAGFAFIHAQAAPCQEQHNWYIQGTGSFGWHTKSKVALKYEGENIISLQSTHKPGFGGALAIGHIIDYWRLELEVSHRENHTKKSSSEDGRIKSNTSLMANVYCDIPVMQDLSIYLGAGAGISSVNGNIPLTKSEDNHTIFKKKHGHLDTVFAWQLMAGLTYALSENWDLVGGYRLFATTKPTLAKSSLDHKLKIKTNNIPVTNSVEVGLRFKF